MPAAPPVQGSAQRTASAGNASANAASNSSVPPSSSASAGSSRAINTDWNAEDLQKVVLEYLTKKGFHKTETLLRLEASQVQEAMQIGQSYQKLTDPFYGSSEEAYELLEGFVQQSLDIYKGEMARILWPVFAHMFLDLIAESREDEDKAEEARAFFEKHSEEHELRHRDALLELGSVSSWEQLDSNKRAKLYRSKKYTLTITRTSFSLINHFLMERQDAGGQIVLRLMNRWLDIKIVDGPPTTEEVGGVDGESLMDHEGVDTREDLNLGPMPMDPDMIEDVQTQLREEDQRNGEVNGDHSLTQAWSKVKREPAEDSPSRDLLPLPTYKGVDVEAEVDLARQLRQQIHLGPQASAPSVPMYTFFHTHDGMNTVDFDHQQSRIAAGFSESYVKIWNLASERRDARNGNEEIDVSGHGSPRMIGHSAPVYSVSWSPTPAKSPAFLLTGSGDKTIRLWSADTYKAVVVYKGHSQPVWDVKWGPFGQYFVSGSGDATGRIWSVEHINPLRILAGHLGDIECVNWHPNSAYVVTGSTDKTCRLFDIQRGSAVRLYTGHTAPITCVEISPDGRLLATASEDSTVHVYDLNSAKPLKSFKAHSPGSSIYSLAFSKCSSVLLSGGSDCTVRVWDVKRNNPAMNTGTTGPQGGSDLLATYHTKQTPVYKLAFTAANVACAAGAYTFHDN